MKRSARGGLSRLTAGFLVSVLAISSIPGATPSQADTTPDENAVIGIAMDASGAIRSVTSGGKTELEPAQAVNALPVRVLTSYSRDGKTSSDAKSLAGATGQVRIDIAVHNLTGKLETVSADVNGEAIKREVLIATPLAVAASVRLDGVKPSQIVLPETGQKTESNLTNGVVGVDSSGVTTVQWSALTGFASADTVARFSLVVEAEEFKVPTIDLAVQPGFSINADAAYQKEESRLVAATIATLNDAGQVLTQSGEALAKARKTLSEAGQQIGAKTVSDLQASTARIKTSAVQIAGTLSGLDGQTSALFGQTGSHVAGQLMTITQSVKNLLGDPSGQSPQVSVDPQTCAVKAETPTALSGEAAKTSELGVLGVIHGLSARVDALAAAGPQCQASVMADLDRLLGPETPSEQNCAQASDGLSCLAWRNSNALNGILEANLTQGKQIAGQVSTASQSQAFARVSDLAAAVTELGTARDALLGVNPRDLTSPQLAAMETKLAELEAKLMAFEQLLVTIQNKVADIQTNAADQTKKLAELKNQICIAAGRTTPVTTPANPNTAIDSATADALLKTLSDTACPAVEGEASPTPAPTQPAAETIEGYGRKMNEQLKELAETTSQAPADPTAVSLRNATAGLTTSVAEVRKNFAFLNKANRDDSMKVAALVRDLDTAVTKVVSGYGSVEKQATELRGQLEGVSTDLATYLDTSYITANQTVDTTRTNFVAGVNDSRTRVRTATGEIFDTVSGQLAEEAEVLRNRGGELVRKTGQQVENATSQLAEGTVAQLDKSAQALSKVTANAIKDSDAVSKLLAEDIAKVLNDIGSGKRKGSGLLGALASSDAHLGVTDAKLAGSATYTSNAKSQQLAGQSMALIEQARAKASLSRLEQPLTFPSQEPNTPGIGWFSFHMAITNDSER